LQKKIRVVHCLEQVRSGGVERRRLSLARRLDSERFEQMLICTEASPELRAKFESAGCAIAEIGPLRRGVDWAKIQCAAQILREFRPDITHGAVFEGVIIAALAGRLAGAPIVIAEETITPIGRRVTGHLYFRFLAALADEVVAISNAVSDYLIRTIKLPRAKVRLIYNGVADPGPASAAELANVRAKLGLTEGVPVVGTVGRLAAPAGHPPDSHKHVADAIFSMNSILKRFPATKMVIIGDGPDRKLLEQRAAEAGLGDSVLFVGFQSNVRPFLESMDILIHASATEGLPLALVEAMFASCPVVATDVGGSNEVVVDGETGFLVPFGAPQNIADRTVQLLAEPALRQHMGALGLKRAQELFSEDRYVREVSAMYDELLRQRTGERR
jgi:glycosyltransferase involved in cell wall biosynthesis